MHFSQCHVSFKTAYQSKPFEMKNRIVQLQHRYPVLEYFFGVLSFFLSSLVVVVVLVLLFGWITGG